MLRAVWNDAVLAESAEVALVEGNAYFPREALRPEHLRPSSTRTVCPWKGTAHYFHVVVGDRVNEDAAWTYPDPRPAAAAIQGRVAFWRGVRVEEDTGRAKD